MPLNACRDEAAQFLQSIRALDEPLKTKLRMLQEELDILHNTPPGDAPAIGHQVYDMLFLLCEIAAQYDIDLDGEWAAGRIRKAKKYR